MRCLSLFSGAGGLDLGLKAAGFELAASVEMDSDCCETLRANFNHKVSEKPVEEFSQDELAGIGSIDLVAGGPPCQPFSKSAMWTNKAAKGLADSRANSLRYYFDCIEKVQPKAFVLENVEGFVTRGGLAFLEERLRELAANGLAYELAWRVLDAANYGVPQHRRRFIAVGTRTGISFQFPDATHGTVGTPFLTAWDAIAGLSLVTTSGDQMNPRGRWADLIPSIPAGKNYLWHTSRGGGLPLFGWRTRYWSFLLKLDPDRPAPTVVANPSQNSGPFHWDNRLLSISELAAIQTFPVTFSFAGSAISQRRQLGNAVPPLLAEVLGRALVSALGEEVRGPLVHLPMRAVEKPQIPAGSTVSAKYLPLVGDHAEHPGTGLGPKPRLMTTQTSTATGSTAVRAERHRQ